MVKSNLGAFALFLRMEKVGGYEEKFEIDVFVLVGYSNGESDRVRRQI